VSAPSIDEIRQWFLGSVLYLALYMIVWPAVQVITLFIILRSALASGVFDGLLSAVPRLYDFSALRHRTADDVEQDMIVFERRDTAMTAPDVKEEEEKPGKPRQTPRVSRIVSVFLKEGPKLSVFHPPDQRRSILQQEAVQRRSAPSSHRKRTNRSLRPAPQVAILAVLPHRCAPGAARAPR